MEKRQFTFRRRENLHFSGTDFCLRINQKIPLLLHGLDWCSTGLQEYYSIGAVHKIEEGYTAHCNKSEEKYVPVMSKNSWNLQS